MPDIDAADARSARMQLGTGILYGCIAEQVVEGGGGVEGRVILDWNRPASIENKNAEVEVDIDFRLVADKILDDCARMNSAAPVDMQ